MSQDKDKAYRSVEIEVEIPGTPESVWQAIATGPGISTWFVPSEVEEREGGAVVFHIAPGMDSAGTVKAWEPPRRFAYEEPGWGGEAPPLATELVVEAQSGGVCRVRLVHSLFTSSEQWDDQLESMKKGWIPFFEVLRLYQTHFSGQRSVSIRLMGPHPGSEAEAWQKVASALGLEGARTGERREAPAGAAPPLAGTVESTTLDDHHGLTMRLERPGPGVALIGTFSWGSQVQVAISLYLYGDDAASRVAQAEPIWQAWVAERFPWSAAASPEQAAQ